MLTSQRTGTAVPIGCSHRLFPLAVPIGAHTPALPPAVQCALLVPQDVLHWPGHPLHRDDPPRVHITDRLVGCVAPLLTHAVSVRGQSDTDLGPRLAPRAGSLHGIELGLGRQSLDQCKVRTCSERSLGILRVAGRYRSVLMPTVQALPGAPTVLSRSPRLHDGEGSGGYCRIQGPGMRA